MRREHCSKPRGHRGLHVADLGGAVVSWSDAEADNSAVEAESRFGGFDADPTEDET
jgi:hypothetical protein